MWKIWDAVPPQSCLQQQRWRRLLLPWPAQGPYSECPCCPLSLPPLLLPPPPPLLLLLLGLAEVLLLRLELGLEES